LIHTLPETANRLHRLPAYPFAIHNQRVSELNAQGYDVINMDVGSPDMPPPPHVVEALSKAAHDPNSHGYSGYQGTAAFREAIARYYVRRFGVQIDPQREVLPLMGSKEGIVNLSLTYLDHGDVALVPDIGYPSYSMGATLAGGDVYWVSSRAETGYRPDLGNIPADVLERAKLLWVNYPTNPTGATVDRAFYTETVAFCRTHGILLASDSPYIDVTYDGYVAGSALEADGAKACTVEFISFSKSHNMAGWRLGAAVGSAEALDHLLKVKSNIDSGHFQAVYTAGIAALEETSPEWMIERNAVYARRRDRILQTLPNIGLTAGKPAGALYIWAKVANGNGATFAENALTQAHVSLAPGAFYGPGGENYVRMSLTIPDARLEIALQRLENWAKGRL